MKKYCNILLGVAVVMLNSVDTKAQLSPVLAGAESQTPGSKLAFINHMETGVESGYSHKLVYTVVTNLTLTNSFYLSTNTAFQAASTTESPLAAAIGSFIVSEVVSVSGPEGGVVAFWEQGSRTPTFMFPVGVTPKAGENLFDVSQIDRGAGLPDGDPFGAIPGRRFTVNKPGEYTVGFKLHDTSKNHPTQEAPIHLASDVLNLKFHTTIETWVRTIAVTNNIATLMVHQGGLTNLFVDAKEDVMASTWSTVAGPFETVNLGTNFTTVSITNSVVLPNQFFRLRGVAP